MASTVSELLRRQLRLLKPLSQWIDIEGARRAQDAFGELGARVLHNRVNYVPELFDTFEADWAHPVEPAKPEPVLYLHGGSYTAGSLHYAKGFGGVIADACGRSTLCIGYRLAPEHPFPAALDDALSAYKCVLARYPNQPVAIVGESAGGGLTLALTLKIRELGLPMPYCLVTLSPWVDLSCTAESFISRAEIDPCLDRDALLKSAQFYSGGDLLNPFISPINGDFGGFPPVLIFAGTHEMLMDDSVDISEKLTDAGVPCELHVVDEMWHVFVIYGTPEGREAVARIADFLTESLPEPEEP